MIRGFHISTTRRSFAYFNDGKKVEVLLESPHLITNEPTITKVTSRSFWRALRICQRLHKQHRILVDIPSNKPAAPPATVPVVTDDDHYPGEGTIKEAFQCNMCGHEFEFMYEIPVMRIPCPRCQHMLKTQLCGDMP